MTASIRHDEWWKQRVGILERIAADIGKCGHEVVYEKDGFWPAMKLVVMQYAFGFYLPIMRKGVERGHWDSLHYVDLCAGSGLTLCKPSVREGVQVVKAARPKLLAGTALIAADVERQRAEGKRAFDSYHFVEPHPESLAALKDRVGRLVPSTKVSFYPDRPGDAVAKVAEAIRAKSGNPHFLVVVDPNGLTEVSLPELEILLKLGRGDVLFNYQYMGLNRHKPSATKFFGTEQWPVDGTDAQLKQYFHKRMAAYRRGATSYVDIKAGKGRYGYEVAYSTAVTSAESPWLQNFDKEITRRVEGLNGQDLENVLFGQTTLF